MMARYVTRVAARFMPRHDYFMFDARGTVPRVYTYTIFIIIAHVLPRSARCRMAAPRFCSAPMRAEIRGAAHGYCSAYAMRLQRSARAMSRILMFAYRHCRHATI